MPVFTWLLGIIAIIFGLACSCVALGMLFVWGVEGRRYKGTKPPKSSPLPPIGNPWMHSRANAWVRWEWKIQHPAFYLLLLGVALSASGILLFLPNHGNLPWISQHIEGVALFVFGLILLRGTLKISSPLLLQKITLIKRPFDGKARPSLPWMILGLILAGVGLYGMACGFAPTGSCINSDLAKAKGIALQSAEYLLGAIMAMGLEGIVQAKQERTEIQPISLFLLGVGLLGLIAALIGKAT